MPDVTTQLLANLQAVSPEGFPYLFISPERLSRIKQRIAEGEWNGKSETINNITKNFQAIRQYAGIPRCTIHDLR